MQMLDYLFPVCCPICLKPVLPKGGFIHEECKEKINLIRSPFCVKCGRRIKEDSDELCSTCKKADFAFDAGRCTFVYHSEIRDAIKWLKEEGTCEFADFFGKIAAEKHVSFLKSIRPDVIVPIPLAKGRERMRGFNQAELFANSLSKHTGVPVKRLLVKTRSTKEQKGLNRLQREQNLSGAFRTVVSNKHMPEKVLLVDDIFTTGSTVNACATALKKAGAQKVYFICIAAGTADD